MIRQVEDRILIGGRGIFDPQGITIQRVTYGGGEGSGETLISVLAYVTEFNSILYLVGFPNDFIEPDDSAVKRISPSFLGME